jgi:hypothetical protein
MEQEQRERRQLRFSLALRFFGKERIALGFGKLGLEV